MPPDFQRGQHQIKSLDDLPCAEQTFDSVKAWMKANAKIGAIVAIRYAQGNIWEYQTAQIVDITPRFVFIDKMPAWGGDKYYYSGKSTRHPTSKTNLVIPTDALLKAAENRTQFIL